LLGTYVSQLNKCDYCFNYHKQGIKSNYPSNVNAEVLLKAINAKDFSNIQNDKQQAGAEYAKKLILDHTSITNEYTQSLRGRGLDDGEERSWKSIK